MTGQPLIALNDGVDIPQFGLGVWQTDQGATPDVVRTAIAAGYRHVDTAAIYRNEAGVGEGLRGSQGVFVTTKLWNDAQGYDSALRAFDQSAAKLGLERLDLYLIHWPQAGRGLYLDSWRALIRLRAEGRVRSIGVSNFQPDHLRRLIAETGVTPAVNQVELHPRFQQRALRAVHADLGVATESWSPLGRGGLIGDPIIGRIAKKHGKTPAQIIIRWHLDHGLIVIPKSANPGRIRENIEVFDFRLDQDDLGAIDGMDRADGRIGPDPDRF